MASAKDLFKAFINEHQLECDYDWEGTDEFYSNLHLCQPNEKPIVAHHYASMSGETYSKVLFKKTLQELAEDNDFISLIYQEVRCSLHSVLNWVRNVRDDCPFESHEVYFVFESTKTNLDKWAYLDEIDFPNENPLITEIRERIKKGYDVDKHFYLPCMQDIMFVKKPNSNFACEIGEVGLSINAEDEVQLSVCFPNRLQTSFSNDFSISRLNDDALMDILHNMAESKCLIELDLKSIENYKRDLATAKALVDLKLDK